MTAPAAPPRKFQAECPKCDKLAEHEEFQRESRRAQSPQAAARGEFKPMMEYSFRCSACGQRNEKLVDPEGLLHKWQGNRHILMRL